MPQNLSMRNVVERPSRHKYSFPLSKCWCSSSGLALLIRSSKRPSKRSDSSGISQVGFMKDSNWYTQLCLSRWPVQNESDSESATLGLLDNSAWRHSLIKSRYSFCKISLFFKKALPFAVRAVITACPNCGFSIRSCLRKVREDLWRSEAPDAKSSGSLYAIWQW